MIAAAQALAPLVKRTRQLGCKLGLYNHGNWGGKPANLVAVCERLRRHPDDRHVGIVYNLHHDHVGKFKQSLDLMQPYLICLNLNGMNDGAKPKIIPLGQGQHEANLIQIIRNS